MQIQDHDQFPQANYRAAPRDRGSGSVICLGELVMILDLHRQALSPTAIARRLGIDRNTVRK